MMLTNLLKLLVIGSGGREHAIAWKLAQSPRVGMVYVAPGNAGTVREPKVENIPHTHPAVLADFASQNDIAFTVVGPEGPLAEGMVDLFRMRGLKIFGPTKAAAQLESSKKFAKDFMRRHGIPTANYQWFATATEAHVHVNERNLPMVVKGDGLAGGKAAHVCQTLVEAHEAIDKVVALGDAGKVIIVEDCIDGEEVSFIVMCDGHGVLELATSQDHKRLLDGDEGPMTGGMGADSPAPIVTPALRDRILREIIAPAVLGVVKESNPFTGFLYAGLMIDVAGNPWVLEFNCRLGDPETQPIMMRLKSDLCGLIEHGLSGTLHLAHAEWDPRPALGVVLAADGYPNSPRKGDEIVGLPEKDDEDCKVFHAGTVLEGDKVVTSGGRVCCVAALGDGFEIAQMRAYKMAEKIHFDGKYYRKDIGDKVLAQQAPRCLLRRQ